MKTKLARLLLVLSIAYFVGDFLWFTLSTVNDNVKVMQSLSFACEQGLPIDSAAWKACRKQYIGDLLPGVWLTASFSGLVVAGGSLLLFWIVGLSITGIYRWIMRGA